mmetsp:Transcript_4559/g.17955  ORF Transcript_4559/g.17955 Transcript_4559/m.17955 type:complete len:220 (+) Transcript_4559:1085-1744(+)
MLLLLLLLPSPLRPRIWGSILCKLLWRLASCISSGRRCGMAGIPVTETRLLPTIVLPTIVLPTIVLPAHRALLAPRSWCGGPWMRGPATGLLLILRRRLLRLPVHDRSPRLALVVRTHHNVHGSVDVDVELRLPRRVAGALVLSHSACAASMRCRVSVRRLHRTLQPILLIHEARLNFVIPVRCSVLRIATEAIWPRCKSLWRLVGMKGGVPNRHHVRT